MSAAARKAVSLAQKRRWAAWRRRLLGRRSKGAESATFGPPAHRSSCNVATRSTDIATTSPGHAPCLGWGDACPDPGGTRRRSGRTFAVQAPGALPRLREGRSRLATFGRARTHGAKRRMVRVVFAGADAELRGMAVA